MFPQPRWQCTCGLGSGDRGGWCGGPYRLRRAAKPARGCLRCRIATQAAEFEPVLAAVGGAEEGSIFNAGVDGVGVSERWLDVPHALELPRVRGPVVPLMGAGRALVGELIADRIPCDAAVIGALDHLPEPTAGLRGV